MSTDTPQIAPILLAQRRARKLTLEQLAARSGVSKSMLSQIERGAANPTFAVLWSLTQALGIEFSELVAGHASAVEHDRIEISPATAIPEIRDEDGGATLRILSPPGLAGEVEWYELRLEEGAVLTSPPHAPGAFEHLTALREGFVVTSGKARAEIRAGETARYRADIPHSIANTGKKAARGLLVVMFR